MGPGLVIATLLVATGPSGGSDQTEARSSATLEKLEEAIVTILEIITSERDPRPDYLHRLAELLLQKSALIKTKEMLAHDSAYVRWLESGEKGRAPQLTEFVRESTAIERSALHALEKVISGSPSYAKADEVLFRAAIVEKDLGLAKESQERLEMLLSRYPKSPLLGQALIRMGDSAFEANSLPRARRAFEGAYERGDREVRSYALYKLAWCDFNANEYDEGIVKLTRLAKSGDAVMKSEVEDDLPLFFARAERVEEALAHFSGLAPDLFVRGMSKTAAALDEQGKWALAVEARRRVLSALPGHSSVPETRVALMASLSAMESDEQIVAEAPALLNAMTRSVSEDRVVRVVSIAHDRLRAAQKSKAKRSFEAAAALYGVALRVDSAAARQARPFFADALSSLGREAEAAKELMFVASDSAAKDRKAAAAEAHRLYLELAKEGSAESVSEGVVASADALAILDPNAEETLAALFNAANVRVRQNRRAEALTRFEAIADRSLKTRAGQRAALAALDLLVGAEEWVRAESKAERWLEVSSLPGEVRKDLEQLAQGAAYNRLLAVQRSAKGLTGDARELAFLEVAEGFERLARKFPQSQYADEAWMSSALLLAEIRRVDLALGALGALERGYPKSEHSKRAAMLTAELRAAIADFEGAARAYERYWATYSSDASAPDALVNAGEYWEAIGENERARAAFQAYARGYPSRKDSPFVALRACDTYRSRWREVLACVRELARRHSSAGDELELLIRFREATALQKLGKKSEANRLFETIASSFAELPDRAKTAEVRMSAAKSALEVAESRLATFRKLTVSLQQKSMSAKVAELEALTCARGQCSSVGLFVRVIEMGDPESAVTALARMGDAFANMAAALRASPRPVGLTDEQLELYEALLAERIIPIEERGIEAYELAVSKARELGVFTPAVVDAYDRAAALASKPADAPPAPRVRELPTELLTSPIQTAESSTRSR
ncbi:MAG: tetratricopeptide repeat protein [Deltaproteobacteria bacterium]|nr:tetratricopeptide repeat protein [Deltaproteobacteria bacterium]